MSQNTTVVNEIVEVCARHGVRHVFGIPGGGSSLDLIRAFAESNIQFVLTHSETAATMMAAAYAELGGGIGVAITTQGPGTASAANGVAHASLDRAPIFLISDGWTAKQAAFDSHQVFDQRALLAPVVKATSRVETEDVSEEIEALVTLMQTEPWGPVYLELTGENARRVVERKSAYRTPKMPTAPASSATDEAIASARAMLESARKPVILLGLEARARGVAAQVQVLARKLGCPILATYKAKGIVSDDADNMIGLFTGGAAETECAGAADLIVLCGFDPVELIGRPWAYTAPVLDLAPVRHPVHYVKPEVGIYQPLIRTLVALSDINGASEWTAREFQTLRWNMRSRLTYEGNGTGLTPEEVVCTAQEVTSGRLPRATVDAGAHMFSVMAFWQVRQHGDILISNGLASMGFALPAAIATALHSPDRSVVAFTGDGGLMMCLGELATAAQYKARICVVVFNDAGLSLISIKQRSRQLPTEGVDWPRPDLAAVARGLGLEAFSASNIKQYREALALAHAVDGPSLIDVHVDPSGYLKQSIALRG